MATAKKANKTGGEGRVKITLPRARGTEARELFIGVNGVNYLIPRGKEVEVPDFVAEEALRADKAEQFMYEEKDRLLAEAQ